MLKAEMILRNGLFIGLMFANISVSSASSFGDCIENAKTAEYDLMITARHMSRPGLGESVRQSLPSSSTGYSCTG